MSKNNTNSDYNDDEVQNYLRDDNNRNKCDLLCQTCQAKIVLAFKGELIRSDANIYGYVGNTKELVKYWWKISSETDFENIR